MWKNTVEISGSQLSNRNFQIQFSFKNLIRPKFSQEKQKMLEIDQFLSMAELVTCQFECDFYNNLTTPAPTLKSKLLKKYLHICLS